MNTLLTYHGDHLKDPSKPDVTNWAEIYKVIGVNVSPMNRFGEMHFPYRFAIHPTLEIEINEHNKSYAECCLERAEEICLLARIENKKIGILYSGGIDSTVILAAFMQVINDAWLRKNVVIFMNQKSIQENPNFYYSAIRNSFITVASSENFGQAMNDPEYLMVDGEHNDQLFGTDLLSPMITTFGFDYIFQKCTRENVTKFFTHRGMSQHAADLWYHAINDSACYCPVPIRTIFDFFWWYNFNFKWQSVFFRIALRSDECAQGEQISRLNDLHFQHFFSSPDFQNWSIFNKSEKIKSDWASYKYAAKKFIYDFNKDEDYFKNKLKFPSLANLFFNKKTPVGLTSDLTPLFSINKEDFYLPNNHFK